jgi:hypothetical protein
MRRITVQRNIRSGRRPGERVPLFARCVCLLAIAGIFLLAASAANGSPTSFGSEGEGAGEFREPGAVAVNNGGILTSPSAGDVYVADSGDRRVDKFSPEGVFLLAWGWGVADGEAKPETCGPDATPVSAICRAGLAGAGGGQFEEEAAGVAIDDSSGPARGDVYVEDVRNHRVEKFSEDGSFLLAWGWGVANGAKERQTCGPEAAVQACQAGLESQVPEELGALGEMHPRTIAVGASGTVYVAGAGEVEEFSPSGVKQRTVRLAGAGQLVHALSVDGAGAIYAASEASSPPVGEIRKYSSSGAELPPPRDPTAGFGSVIAVGPSNDLLVDAEVASSPYRLDEFDAAGAQLASFASPQQPSAIAADDQTGAVYVLTPSAVFVVFPPPPGPHVESEEAVAEPQGAVTVKATIDPEGAQTHYHIEYGVEEAHETATETRTMAAEGFEAEAVAVRLTGLAPSTTYHYRVVVENANGTPTPTSETFTTLPPVAIVSESVVQVTARGAELSAVLNPLGSPTEYHFEYGPSATYGESAPVPDASAGAGTSPATFSIQVQGLTPGSLYHYRVVAVTHNGRGEREEEVGPDQAFETLTEGGGAGLLDGRGWEQVSPPDKRGIALEAINNEGGDIQAADGGEGLAYIAKGPVESEQPGNPAGNRAFAESELLATRSSQGWSTEDIATPHEAVAGLTGGELSEYRLFSPELSNGLLEPTGATPLSSNATERTPYIRERSGEYSPLANLEDVAPATKFGALEERGLTIAGTGVQVVSATTDLNDVLLTAPQALVQGFETDELAALYEWSAEEPPSERLTPVSILPGGASAGVEGGASAGGSGRLLRNAISANGERVVFETGTHHLFLRDLVKAATVRLDAPEEGAPGGESPAAFEDASSDGSRVFFKDEARLTRNATAKVDQPDLYMCEVKETPGGLACSLTDLTVGAHAGEAANVQGAMIGSSEDGSYAYFVANGVLSNHGASVAGAIRGDCVSESATPTANSSCNLYVWHDGVVSLVGVLSGADLADWEAQSAHTDLAQMTARVSPNGLFLAFMSERPLTRFDNLDTQNGAADEEVFEYDAESQRLVCASCAASGARPEGVLTPNSTQEAQPLVDRSELWSERWLAGLVPGWTTATKEVSLYQSRYLDDSGRLFFDSPVALVPGDRNGTWDVYEWEPAAIGRCSASLAGPMAIYRGEDVGGEGPAGCVGLISSGSSSEESAFLDASGSGDDVFFLTAAKLAAPDRDSALDVYDAHVCTSASPCLSPFLSTPSSCVDPNECKGAVAAQPEGAVAPASQVYTAPPSELPIVKTSKSPSLTAAQLRARHLAAALKACRGMHDRRKRQACERAARRRYGPLKYRKGKAKKSARHPPLAAGRSGGGAR